MNYKLRRPQPSRKPEQTPASLAMLADQFQAKEWPVGRGKHLVAGPPAPQPQPQLQLGFPAPDWEAEAKEARERDAAQPAPATKPVAGTAIESMMSNAVALGEAEWPQLDLRPAAVLEPLRRPEIPAPSWREELAAAEARDERDRLTNAAKLLGLEPAPKPTYPAAKRTALPLSEPEPGQLRPEIPPPPWKDDAA